MADTEATKHQARSPVSSAGARLAWPAILIMSMVGSTWLLGIKTLGPWVHDLLANWYHLFYLLGFHAFLAGLMSASVLLLLAPAHRRRLAAMPLLVSLVALGVFLFAPLSRPLALVDFQRHYDVRAEVVRRLEAGELAWSGANLGAKISLPSNEFPPSVSSSAGDRYVLVFQEDGALHVTFLPRVGSWPGPRIVFLYRSDSQAPLLPNRHLPDAIGSEPLAEHWWLVVCD